MTKTLNVSREEDFMKNNKLLIIGTALALAISGIAGITSHRKASGVYAVDTSTQFELVTSVSQLSAGTKVMIGSSFSDQYCDGYYFVNTDSNNNNRKMTSATVTDNKVTWKSGLMYFTVGGSDGAWTFHTENYGGIAGYLNATSGTSGNNLKVVASLDNYAYFNISNIASNGDATITCNGKTSRHIMYGNTNSGNPITNCYNNQTDSNYARPRIFKEISSGVPSIDLNKASLELAKGTDYELSATSAGVALDNAVWTSDDEDVATVEDGLVTAVGAGSATITVSADGYTPATCSVSVLERISVADALDVIDDLTDGATSTDKYAIEGYIVAVTYAWNANDKNLTYELGDSATATDFITAYKATTDEGTDGAHLKSRDKVVIIGKLQRYMKNGSPVPQVAQGGVTKILQSAVIVPEPTVETRSLYNFIQGENTKALAYSVTGTIKAFKSGATKDEYGNMTLTDGEHDLAIYGSTATASALVWNESDAYAFTNPKDFETNPTTAALNLGDRVTMKLIRSDHTTNGVTTIQGSGVITNVIAVETFTVTFNSMGGSSVTSQNVPEDGNATEPTAPTRSGYTFAGWYTDQNCTDGNEYNFSTPVTGDLTLYAKWVEKATAITETGVFVKVTNTSGLEDGAKYAIAYDGSLIFDGSLETLDAASNNLSAEDEELSVLKTALFTIKQIENSTNYSIKSESGLYIGQTTDGNGLKSSAETVYENTISFETNGDANIVSGGAYLRYNSDANSWRFRYYKSSTYTGQKAIQLYKLINPKEFLTNTSSLKNLYGTETGEGNSYSVTSIAFRFGATISKSNWDYVASKYNVTDYGLMLVKKTTLTGYGCSTIEAAYANDKDLFIRSKTSYGAYAAPQYDSETDNYYFTLKINVSDNVSDHSIVYCAVPFIVADGEHIFLQQVECSVHSLAEELHNEQNYPYLTNDALAWLMTH